MEHNLPELVLYFLVALAAVTVGTLARVFRSLARDPVPPTGKREREAWEQMRRAMVCADVSAVPSLAMLSAVGALWLEKPLAVMIAVSVLCGMFGVPFVLMLLERLFKVSLKEKGDG